MRNMFYIKKKRSKLH